MKVSIIIPIYNVEKYIERCIKSVMCQTYTNIECILVDDNSTDNSAQICKELINNYKGDISFTFIKQKKSEGPSGARNIGTDAATGDYIFYLDSDDEITPQCITLLSNAAQKYPDAEIIQGCTIAEKNKDYYSLNRYSNISYITDNEWIRNEYFRVENSLPVDVWNKLIKKDFLTNNNIQFRNGIIHEDQLWSYYVVLKLQRLCFVHENTYIHYSVPMSIMTSLSIENSYRCWGKILQEIIPQINGVHAKLQLKKYLLEYIEKHDYFQKANIHTGLLDVFIEKAKKTKEIKLAMALHAFKWLEKAKCNASVRQWLLTYCRYGITKNLINEFYFDIKSVISRNYEQIFTKLNSKNK